MEKSYGWKGIMISQSKLYAHTSEAFEMKVMRNRGKLKEKTKQRRTTDYAIRNFQEDINIILILILIS